MADQADVERRLRALEARIANGTVGEQGALDSFTGALAAFEAGHEIHEQRIRALEQRVATIASEVGIEFTDTVDQADEPQAVTEMRDDLDVAFDESVAPEEPAKHRRKR